MAKGFGSFPHPVLAAGLDDIDSELRVQAATVEFGVESIRIHFDLILDDEYFLDLLALGRIAVKSRVRSGAAMSVQSVTPDLRNDFGDRRQYSVTYSQSSLRGRATFDVLLVAVEPIDDYAPPRMSSVFEGAQFGLLPGDVVGVAAQIPLNVEKEYDPLNPPFDSCFRFDKDPTLASGIRLDAAAGENQMVVKMAPELYERFGAQAGKPAVQIATVMLPALIATLDLIKESGDTFLGLDWHTALEKLWHKHGGGDTENYLIAQKILEDPITAALTALDEWEWGND